MPYALCPMPYALCPMRTALLLRKAIYQYHGKLRVISFYRQLSTQDRNY
ncbi:MAG: hypothetical protein WBL95_25230 [Microcoleus sp.]